MTIKVMIVDDSSVVRQVMQDVLARHRDIEVIATAPDPIFAMTKMKANWPDVLLLDIEMPRMDGITFLKQIMAERPTPVVICSTLTERGADITMEAFAAGAVGVITKPSLGLKDFLQDSSADLVSAIRAAGIAKVGRLRTLPRPQPSGQTQERMHAPKLTADAVLEAPVGKSTHLPTTEKIIALGTSTGGTQALEVVLTALPRTSAGIVIVQHMPEKFTKSFADRLNTLCEVEVREAQHNDRILPGRALIAPGGKHMVVKRRGAQYYVEVVDGPLVSRHRPSVDVLFRSVAKAAGRNAVGIIMTGMGDDGARGLKELHDTGATTYAQDEASCVVFGMPKEAIDLGGVNEVVPLDRIPAVIERHGR
ncbi:two-component system, chemotaxis family, response regulator CheB [Andreprevotia lacus DSM 23236]|jgi:two-component system chemotaxis response regulator CheB|uniref:Protein-glutamate methylesterase/protein-glutamine glutaminase n=1 Tax=Andreprevotia lacus DSM 23236 TaxID=1121001 RepID=A0A1W1X2I9_9NEIS|nr:chemotaxis response regulator protein-glutamate methylesterase [Andreprevotia lacus]SMC18117.1 two-component system, chemotaxis family, response regulator CheB [Andreprevotia lacus DSM 23236]